MHIKMQSMEEKTATKLRKSKTNQQINKMLCWEGFRIMTAAIYMRLKSTGGVFIVKIVEFGFRVGGCRRITNVALGFGP